MNGCIRKMTVRSIRASVGRYVAILAIVALGVGFFAGIKSAMPAMTRTADDYLCAQNFADFTLMSTLGFTDEDAAAFEALEGVNASEGTYFAETLTDEGGKTAVRRFESITERVNVPVLLCGRMPERADECLGDDWAFSESDLGRTITVSDMNDEDTLDLLAERSFTVVGIARSPRYISGDRGSTSLGTGTIEGFVLVMPEAFDSEAYHEMLLDCDLPGTIYSDEYEAALDRLTPSVKALLTERGSLRHRELWDEAMEELADAEAELADGWVEYEDGKAEAERELADALQELNDARDELDAGWRTYNYSLRKLNRAIAQLPDNRAEIERNRQLIADKRAEINAALEQLAAGKKQIEDNRASVAAGQTAIDAGYAQLSQSEAQLTQLRGAVASLRAQLPGLEQQLAALQADPNPNAKEIARLSAEIAAVKARLTAMETQLTGAESAYAAGKKQLDDAQLQLNAGLKQLDDALADLLAKETEARAGLAALDDAERELNIGEAQLRDFEQSYPRNLAQLEEARKKLEDAEAELSDGRVEYEDGKAEAERELADALQELTDGEAELAEARADLPEKLRLDVYALDRTANSGYATFENDTSIVDAIADAFPVFFVLIAALVCITTMTRMVNDERTLIGTMKALGYSSPAIMSKYLLYAGSSSLVGCLFGFFFGTWGMPKMIFIAYNIMYNYSALEYYFDGVMFASCLAVSVPGALLVTYLACRRELSEKPAELMRPKAPAVGKRIFLEYITPLWSRLSFLGKVTLRNAFRHRQRVAMMLLGIGGCTALMVTGFGARDSVSKLSAYQYDEILLYDMSVTLDTDRFAHEGEVTALWDTEVECGVLTWQEPVTLISDTGEKSTHVVAAVGEEIEQLIRFRDDDGAIPYPKAGEAVIVEKLSTRLDLHAGDTALLRLDDGTETEVVITGVCDNYLNHYIYVSPETVGNPRNNTALLRAAEGTDAARLAAELRSEDAVSYVSLTAVERETMEKSMASLDLLVLMLVVCSGALAFITLYNLTNINIMERTREIATVKVLGFLPGETAAYILRENLLLSFLGDAVGLGLGKILHRFVMELVDVEYLTVEIRIQPLSYVWSFAITLIFAALTNLYMRTRLERVDMAESLKSVE